jgi:hypothetical protein
MQTPRSIGQSDRSATLGSMKLITVVAVAMLAGFGILFALGVVPYSIISSFAVKVVVVCAIVATAIGLVSLLAGAPRE